MSTKKKDELVDLIPLLDVAESVYKKQWWDAILMLIERSTQQEIDERLAYLTGFVWMMLYDLHGAMMNKSIKNPEVLELWVRAIEKVYKISVTDLWSINTRILTSKRPDLMFFDIYIKMDHDFFYQPELEEDEAVIAGFTMIAKKVFSESNVGYVINHAR